MLLDHREDAFCDLVTAGDPAEDVDHHAAHGRVREHDLERGFHARFLRSAADVEEVRGAPAGVADGVERGHHQTRAVSDDADVAVQLDEAEAEGPRALLGLLVRRDLLELRELGLAIESVVVDVKLRVPSQHGPILLHEERIDLDHRRIGLGVRAIKPPRDVDYGFALRLGDAGREHERTSLERKEAQERAGPSASDLLWGCNGYVFDVHATDGREHHHRAAPVAVEGDPEVELARDVGGALDVDLLDPQPLDLHAEDGRRRGLRVGRGLGDLDAAGLSATAGVHLRLDRDRRADRLRGALGFVGRRRDATVRNCNARALEHLLRLVLVDLHAALAALSALGSYGSATPLAENSTPSAVTK